MTKEGFDMDVSLIPIGLAYLATPYSKYPLGIERAFMDAAALAARMLRAGFKVYSPIAHTHPLAIHGRIDPMDHAIWLPFDQAMMERSDCLIVAEMESWRESKGVLHEINWFAQAGKPVWYLDPVSLALNKEPWGFHDKTYLGVGCFT